MTSTPTAFGAGPFDGSTAPLRAAVIGLGRMGSTFDEEVGPFGRWRPPHAHAACYRAVLVTHLVAGSDPHPGQREAFARKWDLDSTHLYADYREMLERERPDVVSICTSARPRAAILQDVLTANTGVRAIWAEKPISLSLAEADSMIDACRRAGVLSPARRPHHLPPPGPHLRRRHRLTTAAASASPGSSAT